MSRLQPSFFPPTLVSRILAELLLLPPCVAPVLSVHLFCFILTTLRSLCACVSGSVMSDSLGPHRLLCPWDSPGKNTGVDCCSLLQRIFLTQGFNPGLLYYKQILYHLSYRKDHESYNYSFKMFGKNI